MVCILPDCGTWFLSLLPDEVYPKVHLLNNLQYVKSDGAFFLLIKYTGSGLGLLQYPPRSPLQL